MNFIKIIEQGMIHSQKVTRAIKKMVNVFYRKWHNSGSSVDMKSNQYPVIMEGGAPSFRYREGVPGFNKFRAPRIWSNSELAQFAPLFSGTVCYASAASGNDKQGGQYRDYFTNASEWLTTNMHKDEYTDFELNLETDLPDSMAGICDCVFNHTTLEHIYDCRKAFSNLCAMSRDVVMVVVPYIQQIHEVDGFFSDFWRFTPFAMQRMYQENNLTLRYCSANGAERTSIYLFCIGYRDPKWAEHIPERMDLAIDPASPLYGSDFMNIIGGNVIR
jgi:hypothetical protein